MRVPKQVWIAFLALWPSEGNAAEQYDATQAYLNSFSDFYRQYKSSEDRSPKAAAKIAEKTIDAAHTDYIRTSWEYGKAFLKEKFGYEAGDVSALRNSKQLFMDPEDGKPQPDDHEKITATRVFSNQIRFDDAGGVDSPTTPLQPPPKKQVSTDNLVLDGSNIPKELEFRGPQKKKKP